MFIRDPVPYFAGCSTKCSATPPPQIKKAKHKALWSGQEFLTGCHKTQMLGLAGSAPCSESLGKSLLSAGPLRDHRRGLSPAVALFSAE